MYVRMYVCAHRMSNLGIQFFLLLLECRKLLEHLFASFHIALYSGFANLSFQSVNRFQTSCFRLHCAIPQVKLILIILGGKAPEEICRTNFISKDKTIVNESLIDIFDCLLDDPLQILKKLF